MSEMDRFAFHGLISVVAMLLAIALLGGSARAARPLPQYPEIVLETEDVPADFAAAQEPKRADKWTYEPGSEPADFDFTFTVPYYYHLVGYPVQYFNPSRGTAFLSDMGLNRPTTLSRINLKSGGAINSWRCPPDSRLADVSLDGKRAVLLTKTGKFEDTRVQILDLTVDPPKAIVSSVPYEVENEGYRMVVLACLIDDQHLLTKNNLNKIVLWKLPEMTPVYVHSVFHQYWEHLALSSDRKYFVTEENSPTLRTVPPPSTEITLRNSLTGEVCGRVPYYAPFDAWHYYLLDNKLSPSGKRLLHSHNNGIALFQLSNTGAKKILEISCPMGVDGISRVYFVGDDYLLIDSWFLFDIKKQFVVWRYDGVELDGQNLIPFGNRYVYRDRGRKELLYKTIQLPGKAAEARLAKLDPDKLFVVKPGDKVTVDVRLSDNVESNQKIAAGYKKQLEANGMVVADNQPIKLEITRGSLCARAVRYGSATNRAIGGVAHISASETTAAFTVDGRVVWSNTLLNSNTPMVLKVAPGGSLEAAAAQQRQQTPLDAFILPKLIPAPRDPIGFGVTNMKDLLEP